MSPRFYRLLRASSRFVLGQTMRQVVLHADRAELAHHGGPVFAPGRGGLLAVSHISHLEPFIVGSLLRSPVRWMAREEFYRSRIFRFVLRHGGAFSVDRFGFSLPAVRRAIRLVDEGHLVGIFPEGGVARGDYSMLRAGGRAARGGVCTVSIRTGAPIVPVVVLGTEQLSRVGPWLPPGGRGRLWIAFGQPVHPPARAREDSPRALRLQLRERLGEAFIRTFAELRAHANLPEGVLPEFTPAKLAEARAREARYGGEAARVQGAQAHEGARAGAAR